MLACDEGSQRRAFGGEGVCLEAVSERRGHGQLQHQQAAPNENAEMFPLVKKHRGNISKQHLQTTTGLLLQECKKEGSQKGKRERKRERKTEIYKETEKEMKGEKVSNDIMIFNPHVCKCTAALHDNDNMF